MSLLCENSPWVFLLVTIFVGGGAAWMAGRGIALTWRPTKQIVLYMILLAAFVRFLHFALYEGTLLSLHYYLVDLAAMLIICYLGHRYTRTIQMTSQYHWLYEKTSPFSWREKSA
jgi:small-conductance mechanosensitive channel